MDSVFHFHSFQYLELDTVIFCFFFGCNCCYDVFGNKDIEIDILYTLFNCSVEENVENYDDDDDVKQI